MIETQPTDLQDRVTAAADLGRNIAVSAGAGTGKTTLLIDRLVMLLLGKETPVDRIVALTFTKKAAEEMRDRLESRLRALIEKPDGFELLNERFPSTAERRRALAERALDDIPKAQIGTIHSFAGHLLRLYPVQAQVDPGFREDEGDAFEAAFEPEWRAWLSSELADGAPRAAQWKLWLGALDLADLRALAEALARSGADLGALKRKVDVRPVFAECAARLDDLVRRLGVPPAAPAFAAGLDAMKRIFEQAGGPKPISADGAERAKKIDPPKSWQSDEAAVARLKELGKIAAAAASIDDAAVAAALSAVAPFVRRLRSELGRRGVVSFDDLLLKARDLVRDHKSVRAALKKQYTAFLVDEFQDTDPLQGEILFYLAEAVGHEADDWRGVRLGAGRLFLVGDPKQSIYRFRGADIAAFEE
ncbi:MAG: UvrD-helicase domain-containing protein, partial [Elusimicrobia bacterium]|nr:UvrD-helicase domain-containing protein [Elusimicrobiota bacterium]